MQETMRQCKICGKALQPPRRCYCGDKCAEAARLMRRRVKVRKPRPEPITYYGRVCPDCGQKVQMHIKSKRCPDCQSIADKINDAAHKRAKAAGHTRKIGNMYPCEVCGELYELASGKQRYCKQCAIRAAEEKSRAASRAWYRENGTSEEKRNERKAKRRTNWQSQQRVCLVCGAAFQPENPRQNVCSDACRKVLAKQRQRVYDARRRDKQAAKSAEKEETL